MISGNQALWHCFWFWTCIVCRHRRILQREREYVKSMRPWLEKSLELLASSCLLYIQFEMRFRCILSRVFSYDVVTGFIVLVDKANGLLVDMSGALDGQSKLWATERLSVIMVIGHLEHSSASVGLFLSFLIFINLNTWFTGRHLFLFSQHPPIYHPFGWTIIFSEPSWLFLLLGWILICGMPFLKRKKLNESAWLDFITHTTSGIHWHITFSKNLNPRSDLFPSQKKIGQPALEAWNLSGSQKFQKKKKYLAIFATQFCPL